MQMSSKAGILIFGLILIINIVIIKTEFLVDSPEENQRRLDWNRSKENEITNGKIIFSHTEQQGTFCQNNVNTFSNEFVFQIPSKYIICGCKFTYYII
jgi:hypothetical protein